MEELGREGKGQGGKEGAREGKEGKEGAWEGKKGPWREGKGQKGKENIRVIMATSTL